MDESKNDEWVTDGTLDPEVRDLCIAINALPGIATFESCCGHGKSPFRIWMKVDDKDNRGLFVLARSVDHRYFQYGWRWTLQVCVGDEPYHPLPITYFLESIDFGGAAYHQAQALVENIEFHRRFDPFLQGYRLEELRLPLAGEEP